MRVGKITVQYTQDADSDDEGDVQEIEITAHPVLLGLYDEGKNDYFITLKTERWAFDNIKEINEVLNDFLNRIKEK